MTVVLFLLQEFCKSGNHHCNWLVICVRYLSLFLDVLSLSCTTLDSCAEGLQNALKEASRSFFSNATSVIRAAYRDFGIEEENRDEAVLLFLSFVSGVTEQVIRHKLDHLMCTVKFTSIIGGLIFTGAPSPFLHI